MNENDNISAAASAMGRKGGKARSASKTEAARKNGAKGGRPRHRWFILHRPGNVWSTFEGDRAAAEAECDRLNNTDESGSTTIHAGFATRESCETEFCRADE